MRPGSAWRRHATADYRHTLDRKRPSLLFTAVQRQAPHSIWRNEGGRGECEEPDEGLRLQCASATPPPLAGAEEDYEVQERRGDRRASCREGEAGEPT